LALTPLSKKEVTQMMNIIATHNLPNTLCGVVSFLPNSCKAQIKKALIAKKKCICIKADVSNSKLKFIYFLHRVTMISSSVTSV
jgi:hypothetical protein